MAAPMKPQPPRKRDEPCEECGSDVVLHKVPLTALAGDDDTEYADEAVCTNPQCDLNTLPRTYGDGP